MSRIDQIRAGAAGVASTHTPSTSAGASSTPTSSTQQVQGSPASTGQVVSTRAGTKAPSTAAKDTVQGGQQGAASRVVGTQTATTGTGNASSNAALLAENAKLRDQIATMEKREAEEAQKPSFFRALLEVVETIGRFFTPFFNLISAAFRVVNVAYKLFSGEKVDWVEEGMRLAGDVAGIFFPPAGALANAGLNIWYDESQMLGGMNELYDGDVDVKSGMRRVYNEGSELIGGALGSVVDGAKGLLGDGLQLGADGAGKLGAAFKWGKEAVLGQGAASLLPAAATIAAPATAMRPGIDFRPQPGTTIRM